MKVTDYIKNIPNQLADMSPAKLVVTALMLSILAAGIIYTVLTHFLFSSSRPQIQQAKTVTVIAAAADIPAHSKISKEMVKKLDVPADIAGNSGIQDMADVVGRTSLTKIRKGDMVTAQELSAPNSGFSVSVPMGMRAVTISLNDVTGVNGLAEPGDYVDIYLVSNKIYKNIVYGKMVLPSVLLLAVNKTQISGGNASQNGGQQGSISTATVAVSPEDVLKIMAAQQEGTLYIALRPYQSDWQDPPVPDYYYYMSGSDQNGASASAPAPAAAAAPPSAPVTSAPASAQVQEYIPPASSYPAGGGNTNGIEIIRGNSVSRQEVGK